MSNLLQEYYNTDDELTKAELRGQIDRIKEAYSWIGEEPSFEDFNDDCEMGG